MQRYAKKLKIVENTKARRRSLVSWTIFPLARPLDNLITDFERRTRRRSSTRHVLSFFAHSGGNFRQLQFHRNFLEYRLKLGSDWNFLPIPYLWQFRKVSRFLLSSSFHGSKHARTSWQSQDVPPFSMVAW